MLEAAETEELIVGAFTDRQGRVCPMLAAHRRGARGNARAFARAWDSFGRAKRPRPATERELEILKALLQESLVGPQESLVGTATGRTAAPADGVPGGRPLSPTGGAGSP
jgi:hypothetical protein